MATPTDETASITDSDMLNLAMKHRTDLRSSAHGSFGQCNFDGNLLPRRVATGEWGELRAPAALPLPLFDPFCRMIITREERGNRD